MVRNHGLFYDEYDVAYEEPVVSMTLENSLVHVPFEWCGYDK